jgi:hypothetical protein
MTNKLFRLVVEYSNGGIRQYPELTLKAVLAIIEGLNEVGPQPLNPFRVIHVEREPYQ